MEIGLLISIIGLILSILLSMLAFFRKRRELYNYYSVIWKNSRKLSPKEILGERPCEDFYMKRTVDDLLLNRLESKQNVLIIGQPLSGKTRAVYNAFKTSTKKFYVLVPRCVPMPVFQIPTDYFFRKNKVIFIDDLQHYIEKQDSYHLLFRQAHIKNIPVIAACHSGKEFTKVKNKLTEQNLNIDILFGTGLAEVEKISADTGKHVAEKLGMKWDSIKFNGTIGSIFMRLSEMERRFDNCDIVEKTVLRVLRNLYFAGITDDNNIIRVEWIKKASARYELSAKEFEWAGWLKSLEEKEFLKVMPGAKVWVEDAYLEHVVKPETDETMYEIFSKAIGIFHDDYEVLQFIGETVYDQALDDPQFLEYMNLAIDAFKRELSLLEGTGKVSQLKKVKNSLGEAYWNLSQSLDTLQNSKLAISHYSELLELVSRESETYEYARIKMKIGNVYQYLSFVDGIKENCRNAISSYNEAIEIFSLESNPLDLAQTYNSLGSAYSLLAESGDAVENCKRALDAFSEARKVKDKTGYPANDSFTKFNTANAYMYLSGFEDKEKNLLEAIKLFNEYLNSESVKKSARNTGGTLNNMGYAYMLLAGAADKKANLHKALEIFNEALNIRNKEQMPIDYTETMCNIGEAYKYLSEVEDEEINLRKAKEALEEALTLEEIKKHPMTYSTLKFTLGNVILNLAALNGRSTRGAGFNIGMRHLQEASDAVKGYSDSYFNMILSEIKKRKSEQSL